MKQKNTRPAIAACAITVAPGREIQLFPAGAFRAVDGRPIDAPHWYLDAALATALVDDFNARQNRTVVDYEHQTILASKNGQPAPAAAWFGRVEWRDGAGLFAVDVEWTERATSMIEAGEYKYITPVFSYDKKTGAILRLVNAALTNNPALDGMDAVAASQFLNHDMEALTMNELLEQLRWLLNLPVTSTAEDVVAELQKAIDQIRAEQPAAAASAGFNIASLVTGLGGEIAALKTSQIDPAKFVPVEILEAVKGELTALRAEVNAKEVSDLVTVALSDGRLLPAQENWARDLGGKDIAALTAYLDTAQPVVALTRQQTDGKLPDGDGVSDLTAEQLAVCTAMGVAPEDFKKTLQDKA